MKFSYTKNSESDFLYKESKSNNNKKNSGGWEGRGEGGRVSVFFFYKDSK